MPKKEHDFQSQVQQELRHEKLARRILGVSDTAPISEIKKAYWLLAMKYHPDKNPGNKQNLRRFQNIQNAYDFLVKGKKDSFRNLSEEMEFSDSLSEEYNTNNSWGYFLWWRDKFF